MNITRSIADLTVVEGDVTVTPDSRFWTLENVLIRGNLIVGAGCSNYEVRNIRIEGGGVTIAGLNFHGKFSRVWVDSAPGIGFDVGALDDKGNCNAMLFEQCFARACGSWGWYVKSQSGLIMAGSSADQCAHGGFLFNGCSGTFQLTAESNRGTGMRFWDCHGALIAPYVDVIPNAGHASILIDGGSTLTKTDL